MKKTLTGLMLCLLTTTAAAAEENILQLFGCNLDDGKTMENVFQTLEMLGDNAQGGDDPAFGIFLWIPYRGSLGYDYVWGATSGDLMSMARGANNYVTSGAAEIMQPRFAALGSCNSSISYTEQMKTGVIGTTEDRLPDGLIETFSCQYRGNSDFDDVHDAAEFWQEQVAKSESAAIATYEGFLVRPYRGIREGVDFAWIGTYPDIETWAQGTEDWFGSNEGQAADERFNRVSECQTALWWGYWIEVPQNLQ